MIVLLNKNKFWEIIYSHKTSEVLTFNPLLPPKWKSHVLKYFLWRKIYSDWFSSFAQFRNSWNAFYVRQIWFSLPRSVFCSTIARHEMCFRIKISLYVYLGRINIYDEWIVEEKHTFLHDRIFVCWIMLPWDLCEKLFKSTNKARFEAFSQCNKIWDDTT